MTPKTKMQLESIRQEKRELILNSALETFAMHGYHGSSISIIAQHAGIAKGLMYNYFKSKEELLKAIIEKGVNEITGIFGPSLRQEITPELFKNLIRLYFDLLKQNSKFWRLYFSIALQPNVMEMIAKEFESMVNPYFGALREYYSLQGSKNPEADAIMAHALIDGITINYVMVHHDYDLKMIEEIVTEQLLKPRF
jgi:AcrR family transcriptional regulator